MDIVALSTIACVISVLALLRSVGDHLSYKRELKLLQHRLIDAERLLRLRGNLAHEVAHEIKNPITAILCSVETLDLLIGEQLAPEHRKSLHFIREYGDNLLALVSDFLDVSMAESGLISAHPEKTRVSEIVGSIVGLLQSNATRKRINLKNVTTDTELICEIDPKHLKQIVFNLVHNAVKFTSEGGEIQVIVSSDFPNPFMCIAVKDNGVGIPAEQLPQIFDPYARSHDPHGPGVGLGLAVCRTLVELAGGTVSVLSELGVGSSFEVRLPILLKDSEAQTSADTTELLSRNEKPLQGQCYLVVDEDLGSRESVAKLIEAFGGIVDQANSAVDAISALQSKSYDAVMIDYDLDGGYGCELARMIKEEATCNQTTIIISARNARDHLDLIEAAADKYVEKPLNGRLLLNSLLTSGKYAVTH